MATKLIDVAEKAGVSMTTVSRVINHDKTMNVSKETEEKIWQSVKELGYQIKKKNTKSAVNSKTKNIGYVLTKDEYSFEDSYFSDIIRGIESELISHKCNLSFALSVNEIDIDNLHEKLEPFICDGVILIGDIPFHINQYFAENKIPAVNIFKGFEQFKNDRISINFEHSSYQLVNQLIGMGHKQILYLGDTSGFASGSFHLFDYEERLRGYVMAHLANHIDISPALIRNINWDMETSYTETKKILQGGHSITAVFGANDRMAIGAMRAIQELGYSIPSDISVVGCDNIEFSQYVTPPLTTISYPRDELGKEAIRILLNRMKHPESIDAGFTKNIKFSTKIIERNSVGPAPENMPLQSVHS